MATNADDWPPIASKKNIIHTLAESFDQSLDTKVSNYCVLIEQYTGELRIYLKLKRGLSSSAMHFCADPLECNRGSAPYVYGVSLDLQKILHSCNNIDEASSHY